MVQLIDTPEFCHTHPRYARQGNLSLVIRSVRVGITAGSISQSGLGDVLRARWGWARIPRTKIDAHPHYVWLLRCVLQTAPWLLKQNSGSNKVAFFVFILTIIPMLAFFRRFALMLIVVTMLVAKIAVFIVAVVVIADVETKAVVAVAVVIGFIRSFMATVPVSPHQCGAVGFPRPPAAQGGRRRRLALIDAWRPASPIR